MVFFDEISKNAWLLLIDDLPLDVLINFISQVQTRSISGWVNNEFENIFGYRDEYEDEEDRTKKKNKDDLIVMKQLLLDKRSAILALFASNKHRSFDPQKMIYNKNIWKFINKNDYKIGDYGELKIAKNCREAPSFNLIYHGISLTNTFFNAGKLLNLKFENREDALDCYNRLECLLSYPKPSSSM